MSKSITNGDRAVKTASIHGLAEHMRQPISDSDRMLYRGVPCQDFELVPWFGRLDSVKPAHLASCERRLLDDFRRRALQSVNDGPCAWDHGANVSVSIHVGS